ncbi:GSCFA domain-containing protein [Algibacter miyuki]|uniref:GSCFA domain-containing protein n=1 Tax=Algibacter miyuki TaxID=1306933 RepID=A0ABV5GYA5_9FLAO|nr:GSCFA domain-containing protein [Algibacter miyuki]MDN3666096.1 GSCFA domain-containing protein [Algibacter miyuki]
MKLQTQIPLKPRENNQIDYSSKMLLLGSCFVENIGAQLEASKFQTTINPFGILFHPKAIERLVSNAINGYQYADADVFFNNEQWHCFDAHSKLSDTSKGELLTRLNNQVEAAREQLKNATHIIITLGTSWVYTEIETSKTVANCHKVPQKNFRKKILSVEEVLNSLQMVLANIKSVNAKASVIFTVSPVRHIKDGFIENTQSKSNLLAAIHQVLSENVIYFPSFEIMMDELRDYRFYKEDMLHPNETAIKYIWGKFQQVWISSGALKTMQTVMDIQKGIQHKPFNPNSEAHFKFLQKLDVKKEQIQTCYPHISF